MTADPNFDDARRLDPGARLEARRAELVARMLEAESELESHNNPDWEDRAIERESDEVLEGLGLSAQAELAQIDAALQRLARGDYGVCMQCGADISGERLALLPATPFCRNCAP